MINAVLVVIDLQNDFFERSPVLTAQRDRLVAAVNQLAGGFRDAGLPVIWVRQEFAPDRHDALLEVRDARIDVVIAGTPGSQLLPELVCDPVDRVIVKKRYSAFFGTELDDVLKEIEPQRLVVAGVNTHACVRTTVVDAYQRDYRVMVATECIASRDPEHHDVTVRYLDGKMARFCSNAEILAEVSPPRG